MGGRILTMFAKDASPKLFSIWLLPFVFVKEAAQVFRAAGMAQFA